MLTNLSRIEYSMRARLVGPIFAGFRVKVARFKRIGPPGVEASRPGRRCATGRTTEIVFTQRWHARCRTKAAGI
jgi:hypothetical protein